MPLGNASNKPHLMPLHRVTGPVPLRKIGPGHFLALPPRSKTSTPIAINRTRRFPLPERGEAPANIPPPAHTPAPATEIDPAMGDVVAAQAALSRRGAQLTDPIDLLLAHKPPPRPAKK